MTDASIRNDQSTKPILAALSGVFFFAVLDLLLKSTSATVPVSLVVFLRFFSASVFAIVLWLLSRPSWPTANALRAVFLRACVTVLTTVCFVHAVAILPLANAVVLAYSAPFFMALFGWIMLGERISRRGFLAIAIGFGGIAVTMADWLEATGGATMLLGSTSAVLSGACYALSMILARQRSSLDTVQFTIFGQNVFSALLMLPFVLRQWPPLSPDLLVSFAGIGLSAVVAQCLVVWAFMNTAAARVAPIEFTSILWAGLFGFLFFHERPGLAAFAGAALIAASGLMVLGRRPV